MVAELPFGKKYPKSPFRKKVMPRFRFMFV